MPACCAADSLLSKGWSWVMSLLDLTYTGGLVFVNTHAVAFSDTCRCACECQLPPAAVLHPHRGRGHPHAWAAQPGTQAQVHVAHVATSWLVA